MGGGGRLGVQGGRPSESAGRVLRKQRGESLENNGESLKVYGEEYFGEMFAPSLLHSFRNYSMCH